MSKQLETLIDRGAACVGGDIVLRGKSMGHVKNGVFVISDDGEAELAIDEAVVKSETPKAETTPAPRPARKTASKKAKVEPEAAKAESEDTKPAEPDTQEDLLGDLGDLADLGAE